MRCEKLQTANILTLNQWPSHEVTSGIWTKSWYFCMLADKFRK